MHELAFADAARPTPVVILKLPLRVYSLGHDLLLLKARNALLFSEEVFNLLTTAEQIGAVREAVWLCANTHAENIGQPFVRLKIRIWNFRTRQLDHADYALAVAEFRNYLAAGRSAPPAPDKTASAMANGEMENQQSDKSRGLGAPLIANLINFISCSGRSVTDGNIFDFSYSLAAWLYLCELENNGRMRIENRDEAKQKVQNEADALWAEETAQAEDGKLKAQHAAGLATAPPDFSEKETQCPA